jgi:hypothetical protein
LFASVTTAAAAWPAGVPLAVLASVASSRALRTAGAARSCCSTPPAPHPPGAAAAQRLAALLQKVLPPSTADAASGRGGGPIDAAALAATYSQSSNEARAAFLSVLASGSFGYEAETIDAAVDEWRHASDPGGSSSSGDSSGGSGRGGNNSIGGCGIGGGGGGGGCGGGGGGGGGGSGAAARLLAAERLRAAARPVAVRAVLEPMLLDAEDGGQEGVGSVGVGAGSAVARANARGWVGSGQSRSGREGSSALLVVCMSKDLLFLRQASRRWCRCAPTCCHCCTAAAPRGSSPRGPATQRRWRWHGWSATCGEERENLGLRQMLAARLRVASMYRREVVRGAAQAKILLAVGGH